MTEKDSFSEKNNEKQRLHTLIGERWTGWYLDMSGR